MNRKQFIHHSIFYMLLGNFCGDVYSVFNEHWKAQERARFVAGLGLSHSMYGHLPDPHEEAEALSGNSKEPAKPRDDGPEIAYRIHPGGSITMRDAGRTVECPLPSGEYTQTEMASLVYSQCLPRLIKVHYNIRDL